jgi:hypothetical protein
MGTGQRVHGDRARFPWLLAALVLALTLRAALPLAMLLARGDLSASHTRDTSAYLGPAESLLTTGQFASQGHPEILRTPGYPLLLIPGLILGRVEAVTMAVQAGLGCLTVYLLWRCAPLVSSRPGAAAAGAMFYAFEPLSVIYASQLLTETLFTALFVAGLWLLLRYLREPTPRPLVAAAAAWCAAAWVRPLGYYLPLLVGAWLLGRGWQQRRWGWRLFNHGLVFIAVAVVGLGSWQVRNWLVADYPGFSAVAAINTYFYYAAAVQAHEEKVPYYAVQQRLGYRDEAVYMALHPEQRDWDQAQRYRFLSRAGWEVLRAHPVTTARVAAAGLVRTLFDPGGVEALRLLGWYPAAGGMLGRIVDQGLARTVLDTCRRTPRVAWATVIAALPLGLFLLLASAAVLSGHRPSGPTMLLLALSTGYLLLAAAGPQGLDRFRHPVMPLLCLLAGHGAAPWFSGEAGPHAPRPSRQERAGA